MPQPAAWTCDRAEAALGGVAGQWWELFGAVDGGDHRALGGGQCGGWLAAGEAPELEQVVGAAQQLPLRLAGGQATAAEPAGALLFLELAEDRLDGLLPFRVAGLARLTSELGEHRRAQPSLLDAEGWPSFRGLPVRPALVGQTSSSGASGMVVRLAIDQ